MSNERTFMVNDKIRFTRNDDGSVTLEVRTEMGLACYRFDKDSWASVIANMSYYGEEDYGFYRATEFHSGVPLGPTTPLKQKPPLW